MIERFDIDTQNHRTRPRLTICLLLIILIALPCMAQESQDTQTGDPALQIEHPCITIRKAPRNSAWNQTLKDAQETCKRTNQRITVFRMSQQYPTKRAPLMASGQVLRQFTGNSFTGGSTFDKIQSGEFIYWEHSNVNPTQETQRTIRVGHPASGSLDITVNIPNPGEAQAYDLYFKVCPKNKRGHLLVDLNKPSEIRCSNFTIGMITIGGIYGIDYTWNPKRAKDPIELAPGDYKILFRDINPRTDRFEFKIKPEQTTTLKFKAKSQTDVDLIDQTFSEE